MSNQVPTYTPSPEGSGSPQMPSELKSAIEKGSFKDYANAAFSTTLPGAGLKLFGVDLFGTKDKEKNTAVADFTALKNNALKFATDNGISKELSFSLYVCNFINYLRENSKHTGFNPDTYTIQPIPTSAYKYLNNDGYTYALKRGAIPPTVKVEDTGNFFRSGGSMDNPFENNTTTIIILIIIIIVIFRKKIAQLFR